MINGQIGKGDRFLIPVIYWEERGIFHDPCHTFTYKMIKYSTEHYINTLGLIAEVVVVVSFLNGISGFMILPSQKLPPNIVKEKSVGFRFSNRTKIYAYMVLLILLFSPTGFVC